MQRYTSKPKPVYKPKRKVDQGKCPCTYRHKCQSIQVVSCTKWKQN